MRRVASSAFWILTAGLALVACDALTGKKEPKITLVASTLTPAVAQSGSTLLQVTVAREHFDQAVNLTVDGAPSGITATLTPATLTPDQSVSTLELVATGAATPGTATLTVHAKGDGVTEQTVVLTLTVSVTGNFSLSMSDPSVLVAQGGGGRVTVLIPRSGGNGGEVTVAVTGAPSGVTASPITATTTAGATTVVVAATNAAATGSFNLTVNGTSPGLSQQTTSFTVNVVAPPSTATISLPFCTNDTPTWFAYQNDGYDWQRVTPTAGTFTFVATSRLTVAYAFVASGFAQMDIFSTTRSEIAATTDRDCPGTKTIGGSAPGLGASQAARVVMGTSAAMATATASTFTLRNVANRSLDLVATLGTTGTYLTPDKLIIRRALNPADASTLPALDFTSGEAVSPAANTLTITGLSNADVVEMQNSLWSTTSSFGLVQTAAVSGGTTTLYATPAGQLVAGDVHELFVDASQSTSTLLTGRAYVVYYTTPGDRNDAIGPNLTTPTLSILTNAPYSRIRGQVASQPEYNTSAFFVYLQQPSSTLNLFQVVGVTAGYLGGTPSTWDVRVPDLSGLPGFDPVWMLQGGQNTTYEVEAFSGRSELLFGAMPVAGDLVRYGYRDALTNTTQLIRALRAQSSRQRSRLPQYFRR